MSIKDIIINDAKLGTNNLALVPGTLAPAAFATITQEYTITQADIDAGKVTNTAVAKGQDPQGFDVQDTSGTAIDNDAVTETALPKSASIALVKTGVVAGAVEACSSIRYTFAVTNTGNAVIDNIVITDPMIGLTLPVSTIVSLAPGATNISIVGTYVIKQTDIDAGAVTNSALAVGKDALGNPVQDRSGTTLDTDDPTITDLVLNPSVSATKEGKYVDTTNDGIVNVGDQIRYKFVVNNTGNTSLSNVMITDAKVAIVGAAIPMLASNTSNSTAFSAVYNITQADMDAGVVYNLATVEGTSPTGQKVTNTSTDPTSYPSEYFNPSCPTCTVTVLPQSPKIALILKGSFQDENGDGQAQVGETIEYTYIIMNRGNVTLSNVWIQDSKTGLDINSGSINLPIDGVDNTTFSRKYTITQEDIIAGNVTNQATVFATSPLGVLVQDLSDANSPLKDGTTVITTDGCVLTVFNAVSPNVGTDYDKILYLRGIDCYPNNSVQIFDRWGVKVYDVNGYDNASKAFRGVSEGRTTVSQSKGLPTGTYFYVIKYVNNEGKGFDKSGYLHLIND